MDTPPEIARIERGIAFQRRFWLAERIAWLAMAGFVALALAGLTGAGGPLARAEAEAGGLRAEWPRIQRRGRPEPIQVRLPDAPGVATAELRIGAEALEGWRFSTVLPLPLEASAGDEGLVLQLRRDAAGGAAVVFQAEPQGAPGPRRLRLESGGAVLALPVFVWP